MPKCKIRIQVDITDTMACELFNSIPRGLKAQAIEQALVLLSKDSHRSNIFFKGIELPSIKKVTASEDMEETQPPTTKVGWGG